MHQTSDRTRRARRLRTEQTGAEQVFWSMVRGRGFEGLKFRRQAPVAGFIVDFLCPELRLVIEFDGGVHRLREGADALRDERLKDAHFTVLRFENGSFERNPGLVLSAIREHRAKFMQPPHPTAFGGRLLPRGEKDDDDAV